jgi:hypothetical protein
MGAAVYSITNLQLKYTAFSKIRELKVSGGVLKKRGCE